MEREILFRGITTDKKRFVYGDLRHDTDGIFIGYIIETSHFDEGKQNSYITTEVIPESVGQFIGFTIKTIPKTKVFVGDKVLVKGTKSTGLYTTEVIESAFGFTLKENKTYLNDNLCLLRVAAVVGTIFDDNLK